MANRIFVTADQHFFHARIIELDQRPYGGLAQMHEDMAYRWNEVVGDTDSVYVLGDYASVGSGGEYEALKDLTHLLNGRKYLIKGNHDQESREKYLDMGFKDVFSGLVIGDNILTHEPVVDDLMLHFERNIHGHTHRSRVLGVEPEYGYVNVGCMHWDYRPVALPKAMEVIDSARWKARKDDPTNPAYRRKLVGRKGPEADVIETDLLR